MSLAAGQFASGLLFGLKPYDAVTFLVAIGLLAAVALGASYVPAHRASTLDPTIALRDE
jgi:putative ABC transport system permease protein